MKMMKIHATKLIPKIAILAVILLGVIISSCSMGSRTLWEYKVDLEGVWASYYHEIPELNQPVIHGDHVIFAHFRGG